MATVRVLRVFYDLKAEKKRNVGDVFACAEDRARELASAVPQHVTVEYGAKAEAKVEAKAKAEPKVEPKAETDYSKLTNPELAALCRERGIATKGRPNKKELIALLEESDGASR